MPISPDTLRKYAGRSDIFIETGTHTGRTVQTAKGFGFKKIYSIELSDKWYKSNRAKFAGSPRVKIIHGNSGSKLRELLATINQPCLLWLDAHYSGGDTANSRVPIYDELAALADHHIKTHTILIDDMRGFGDKVVNAVKKINPSYKITYEDGVHAARIFKNDILVAMVD